MLSGFFLWIDDSSDRLNKNVLDPDLFHGRTFQILGRVQLPGQRLPLGVRDRGRRCLIFDLISPEIKFGAD